MELLSGGGGLLSVEYGTVFWTTLAFVIVLILLKKMAWGPILKALKEREESIERSLSEAEEARQEMANLNSDNERMMKEARVERDAMLKEAREMGDQAIADAKAKAKEEADKMVENARVAIQNEKAAAMSDIKNQVAGLSIEIAEKVVKERLQGDAEQQKLVESLMNDVNLS